MERPFNGKSETNKTKTFVSNSFSSVGDTNSVSDNRRILQMQPNEGGKYVGERIVKKERPRIIRPNIDSALFLTEISRGKNESLASKRTQIFNCVSTKSGNIIG